MGLVAPRHVGSSRTRARTHVPCTGGQILNHCATREAPAPLFLAEEESGALRQHVTQILGYEAKGPAGQGLHPLYVHPWSLLQPKR